jgi:hypothetical protein
MCKNDYLDILPIFSFNVPLGDEQSGGVGEIPIGRGVKNEAIKKQSTKFVHFY